MNPETIILWATAAAICSVSAFLCVGGVYLIIVTIKDLRK